MAEERHKQAAFGAWISMMGSMALALLKGTVGYLANSKALMADAAHSASDAVGAFTVWTKFQSAKHPFDETSAASPKKAAPRAVIIGPVLLLIIGLEIGISSVKSLVDGGISAPSDLTLVIALIAIVISIVAKELFFQYKLRIGKQLGSSKLIANAWEHRSEMYSSAAAFVGVAGATLGNYLGNSSLYYLDGLAGLFISVLVIKNNYRIVLASLHNPPDRVLLQEEAADLVETVQRIKGVIAVDDLRAREHGHYVLVDVKLSVNPRISVQEGHDIGRTVRNTLMKRFTHVSDVYIHVNPYDPGYPYKSQSSEQDDIPTVLH